MKKLIWFLLLIPFLIIQPVNAQDILIKDLNDELIIESPEDRVKILEDYLAQYNSPLEPHAKDFIEAADKYNVDWKLVPSIAGVESTFGKNTPGNDFYPSYNGWGWGVYGDQSLGFSSWRDGIFTVTKGLKENYIDDGLTDPYSINRRYAASKTWGSRVTYFMNSIEKFENNYDGRKLGKSPFEGITELKTAGTSAILSFNNLTI